MKMMQKQTSGRFGEGVGEVLKDSILVFWTLIVRVGKPECHCPIFLLFYWRRRGYLWVSVTDIVWVFSVAHIYVLHALRA